MICLASFIFFLLSQRYLKNKASEAGKAEIYKQTKTSISGIMYPIAGVLMIGYVLFNWDQMPSGNKPVGYLFLAFGALVILYGVYCWYRKSRTSRN